MSSGEIVLMENERSVPDPLDIEELYRQARAFVKAFRLPKPDENRPHTRKDW
jgi:hypothetical protein